MCPIQYQSLLVLLNILVICLIFGTYRKHFTSVLASTTTVVLVDVKRLRTPDLDPYKVPEVEKKTQICSYVALRIPVQKYLNCTLFILQW
jgi:hypothetical protein